MSRILPMTDGYTPTLVSTDEGELHIQEYFVRRRCEPRVREIRFEGIDSAEPAPGVLETIVAADIVIVCPSNPFISIGPILAVPGVRECLRRTRATVVCVTPIIGGRAVKGPTADMLRDLGHDVSAPGVAAMYRDFVDVFVLDQTDFALAPQIRELGPQVFKTNTLMNSLADKEALARCVLEAAAAGQPRALKSQSAEFTGDRL
jgi:LPPG:FO 2-phospho-L-lactate transferase